MIFSTLHIAMIGVLGLLAVGLYGLLATRSLIKIVIALQILVKAAVLALVLAGQAGGQINLGQSLAMIVIGADTVVAVIGLALAMQVRRRLGTLDARELSQLRG